MKLARFMCTKASDDNDRIAKRFNQPEKKQQRKFNMKKSYLAH